MGTDLAFDNRTSDRAGADTRFFFVAWRNPETGTIAPVGRLTVTSLDGDTAFEFRYLTRAREVLARPFASFPDFAQPYRSATLFPFFENRMVPGARADFGEWAASLGLPGNSDPFEVLAWSGGLRATDTLEIFPVAHVDRTAMTASFRFLVHGVRHREGADEEIDRLQPGDQLRLVPEPANPVDTLAVLVLPQSGAAVGWAPAYLCPALHRSVAGSGGTWDALSVTVRHIGDRAGPSHLRLLAEVVFPWPFAEDPFDTAEFAVESPS